MQSVCLSSIVRVYLLFPNANPLRKFACFRRSRGRLIVVAIALLNCSSPLRVFTNESSRLRRRCQHAYVAAVTY